MPTFQIVLRRNYTDISGFSDWLKKHSTRYLISQEDADDDVKSTHCHAAIEHNITAQAISKASKKFDLSGSDISIMEKTKKSDNQPERQPYDFDLLAIYCLKGDKHQLRDTSLDDQMVDEITKKWVNRAKKLNVDLNGPITLSQQQVFNPPSEIKSEWTKLLTEFEKRSDYKTASMPTIQKWIKSYYLQQRKPVPRQGDCARYTYSLWALGHDKTHEEDIHEADDEASRYLI